MTTNTLEITALPGERTIVMRRTFAAPRALVFDACTRPEHLRRWWAPCFMTMVECEVDLRVGGRYRFLLRSPDGQEYVFYGEYLEIDRPERTRATWVYGQFPDDGAIESAEFVEVDGKTTLTTTVLHKTVAARDGHLASGMEAGATDSMNQLEALVRELAAQST